MEITKEISVSIIDGLERANNDTSYEFECVFSQNSINKEKLDEVINYLSVSNDFKFIETIHRESLDIMPMNTNYRISIDNASLITDYCKTGLLNEYSVMEKKRISDFEPIQISDYDIRFNLKQEVELQDMKIRKLMDTNDKYFRMKKRYSFLHKSNIFRVDLTATKSSINVVKQIEKSGVMRAPEKYEIEIEYLNDSSTRKSNEDTLETLFNIIEVVKKLLDDTNHLITKTKKELVLCEYLNLVNPKIFDDCNNDMVSHIRKVVAKNPKAYFLSYQPVTLEQSNLLESKLGRLSIQKEYTVTEKADGERMLLFVDKNNQMYTIDSRLNVRYTGTKHKQASCLLDGEFVKFSKNNTVLNNYMAFDVYFMDNKDVRSNKLIPTRYDMIKSFCKNASSHFVVKPKTYLYDEDIFKLSKKAYNEDKYEYHVDGLIYTPMNLSVGVYYKDMDSDKNTFGGTWMNVFKWKPPKENSIDLLTIFGDEVLVPNVGRCVSCKLQVSYKMNSDELIDPIKVLTRAPIVSRAAFVPKDFKLVYLKIKDGKKRPQTQMNEDIYTNTVIEYVYDTTQPDMFGWIPYRVRYDKTELYKKTKNIMNTANSYVTAMNVWRSIQNPVTEQLITGEKKILDKDVVENNVYYSRHVNRMKLLSKPMLIFHNKSIKSRLFALFKNKNYTLIDLACGKAGDLYKWMENRYTFVVGVDNRLDNIMNSMDGAYKRYHDVYQTTNMMMNQKFNAVFLQKDISTPWSNKESIENDTMAHMYDILWGNILRKDIEVSQMSKYYNLMNAKFDVVSCQFAIHYMFETMDALDAFCANVNQVLKVGGYFMGTCLNGHLVNEFLSKSPEGKQVGKINDNVVWMMEKKYDTFKPKSIGQKIDVYLESINVIYEEYLVDFDLLKEKLKQYNITVLNDTDLDDLDMSQSIDTFDKWYDENEYQLDTVFKTYSFLNSWFVFKKYE